MDDVRLIQCAVPHTACIHREKLHHPYKSVVTKQLAFKLDTVRLGVRGHHMVVSWVVRLCNGANAWRNPGRSCS